MGLLEIFQDYMPLWASSGDPQPDEQEKRRRRDPGKHTAFRVSGLPVRYKNHSLTKDDVKELVAKSVRGNEAEGIDFGIDVKSLAQDPTTEMYMIATLHFSIIPEIILATDCEEKRFEFEDLCLDTEFLELTPLHCQFSEPTGLIIVAVSGYGGHPFGSFCQSRTGYMWLRDDLTKFRNAEIYIWGQNTSVHANDSYQSQTDLGMSFKRALLTVLDGKGANRAPLLLIGHSFGGLIIKRALLDLQQQQDNVNLAVLESLRMLMFFAPPTQGMNIDSILPMVSGGANEGLVRSLGMDTDQLHTLAKDWARTFRTREKDPLYQFKTISYYETRLSSTAKKDSNGTYTRSGPKEKLVDRFSAGQGQPWDSDFETVIHIDRDHSNIVKFQGRHDAVYKGKVRTYISSCFGKPSTKQLFAFNKLFFGRDEELGQMKRFFTEEGPGVSVLTLCGIRGVGKTSLAQKYASQCLKDVDRVIFIDAQTDEDFEKSAADFLDEKDDHRDMVGALFRMLKHTSRWLLILDDVYSVSPNASKLRQMHVESLWKKLQNLLTGKVIVTTSRSFHAVSFLRDWRLKECINLKGLDKASELKLVREILGNQHNLSPEDELGTQKLLEVLGGHSLSIVLVACYVKAQPDLTPKEYWKIFQKKLSSYIKPEGECHDDEDERLLHTIWKESVDTVKSRCPAAISILEVWSLLHNLDFRFELLSNYDLLQGTSPEMRTLVRNELDGHRKFSDAMFHLTTFSLIDATSTLPCSYNMPSVFHNWCTQALVVEQHKDSLLSVLECLGTSIPGRKEEGYLKKTTQILLHASRVVEELGDIMVKERNQPPVRNHLENSVFDGKKILIQVNAMMNLAEVFRAQEKLPLARRLLHCTTRVLEAAPESDEKQDVTDGLNEVLGHLHKSENQLKKAKNFYKKALAGYLKRHGPNHDATLGARSNLGSIYTKLEMRNEAEDEFRLVLATEVTTKEGEKLKLDCKQRYATLLSGWKEVANARYKALDFHQQVFDTSLEWYSKNDHRTARAAHNLAHIQRLLQQFQPAKRLYDVYLPILEHYVPNRALLFNAQNGYGDLLRRMRKFKDAERWLLRARQGLQDLDYGPRDMNYAQVAIHLGDLYVAQDRYNDAKVYYEEASFIFQKSGDILACRLSRLQKAEEA